MSLINTLDQRIVDSSGAFLVGQLEKLDARINMPLQKVTYVRDLPIRQDFGLGNDVLSFTKNNYSATATDGTQGLPLVGKSANAPGSVQLDIEKIAYPLEAWKRRFEYSIFELESSRITQQPIDFAKAQAIMAAHQLEVDQTAYIGDPTRSGWTGLYNNASIASSKITSTYNWATATPAEIQSDVNALLAYVNNSAAWAEVPNVLLVSPEIMSVLTQPITIAGSISIKEYIEQNNLSKSMGGSLEIRATKWSAVSGAAGKTRVVAYNQNDQYIQFPYLNPVRSQVTPIGSNWYVDYDAKFGQLEIRYPETIGYLDVAFGS